MRRSDVERKDETIETQRELDTGIILYPKPNDVLIGRGAAYQEHPGSQYWDKLIYAQLARYLSTSKFDRQVINMEIIETIKESGGRFLQRTPCVGWEILDDIAVKDKTSSAFRNRATYKKSAGYKSFPPDRADSSSVGGTAAKRRRL